ncbi:L-serine ammonia-lyase [Dethiosulfatibacter aminovorans DSM 17477]|uniref:L-serine dehydratase n=1 Tax=Dethiosulfatibacter aminovorans DSM 17477 TaxID=1121476 RepID=A0A1M6IC34_9FIRM|nr:L-serine ammonia-lyase, iron-sulfur-dependent, subunit alpha [Dethiosulfatibacter aminovorans]SHJ31876.1 L-serine ammonia-lyase [Dethiosulfatibacter aminovorans DSM 17477]
MYNSGRALADLCSERKISISELVLIEEMENTNMDRESVLERLDEVLSIMENSSSYSLSNKVETLGGIIGGEGRKMMEYLLSGDTVTGEWIIKAMARAFACSEYNASMGKICAAPTAGSCGIIPAAILTVGEKFSLDRDVLLKGLLVSSGLGKIISENATVSGAEGGCQAECGAAAAMAAAAIVEMRGGSPEQSLHAASIALKNIMGLICDPIAGLVESPCSKRNASGVVNAMISADMALSGVESIVPFDEVVEAMYNVGLGMHQNFKETAKGGIAITETGLKLAEKIK